MLRQHVMILILDKGRVRQRLQQPLDVIKVTDSVRDRRKWQVLDISYQRVRFAETFLVALSGSLRRLVLQVHLLMICSPSMSVLMMLTLVALHHVVLLGIAVERLALHVSLVTAASVHEVILRVTLCLLKKMILILVHPENSMFKTMRFLIIINYTENY